MQKYGVVGSGGAGFPSYAKLAEGADTLVINCAECEPLMYTDYTLAKEELSKIAEGAEIIMEYTGIKHAYLAIKSYRAGTLGLTEGQEIGKNVSIKILPNVYPMGDEIVLIYQVTHRVVKPGALPISVGVIVYNAETVYNTRAAVLEGKPVIDKWVTIGGNLPNAYVVKAPIGMKVTDMLDQVGVKIPERNVMFDGGPAMGKIKNPNASSVIKTTKGIIIVPEDIPAVVHKTRPVQTSLRIASSACCQCTRCTDMCPRHLLGYPLEPHKMVRVALNPAEADPELIKTASMCCGCGVCGVAACCQDISPKEVIAQFKGILAKNKMKYTAGPDEEIVPHADRDFKLLTSQKWKELLGVAKFDKRPIFIEKDLTANRVVIPMSQHIGAPSVPVVSVGDKVEKGQLIANAGAGLSVPQYASISGTVSAVDPTQVTIEANA